MATPASSSAVPPATSIAEDNGAAPKAVIKNVDMSEELQGEITKLAVSALDQFTVEKDIAAYIKKECDKKFTPTWHVVAGRNFGSYVTHETRHFIYFYIGSISFLVWKS